MATINGAMEHPFLSIFGLASPLGLNNPHGVI